MAPPLLTELTEEQRKTALARFQLIQPFLDGEVPLTAIARAHHKSLRTLQLWVKQYRQTGLVGLSRQRRQDQGQRRRVHPEVARLIEGLALQRPAPTAAAVHRMLAPIVERQGWPLPSYRTVADIVHNLGPALTTLAHAGTKAYREVFDVLYRRNAQRPNEIWQADHSLLDIWLHDDRGKPARPWLTIIMDDYSRAIAGYFLSFQTPCTLHTALALRQAIWRKAEPQWHVCGIPEVFYSDHGSDFTSQHMEQVSADLKMQLVFSEPGMPRGRGKIERFFATVNQLFLCQQPGYTPDGQAPALPTLTLPVLEARMRSFLLDVYQQRTHSGIKHAPQQRWEAGGFVPHLPESLAHLDLLLLTVAKPRRVRQDGIHFQGFRYFATTLAAYVGEDIIVRYDPRDMAAIRVYQHDTFLCSAVCQELAGQTISLKDIVQARTQRRRQLQTHLHDRAAVVELLLDAHQVPDGPGPLPSDTPPAPRLKRYTDD